MKVLINFADDKFRFSQKVNTFTGKHIGGFDKVIEYSPKDIDNDFYLKNKTILDNKKGAGLWLWKPYFILKTLKTLNEGDTLFYCDSGTIFIRDIAHLTAEMDRDKLNVFITFTPYVSKNWTRKFVFDSLKANNDEYYNALHPSAGFILLKKSTEAENFVTEWIELCRDFDLVRDELKDEENFPEFVEHRHDQSLLSILARQKQLTYYKDISQFGSNPFYFESFEYYKLPVKTYDFKGDYPTILLLHRTNKIAKPIFTYFLKLFLFKLSGRFYYKLLKKNNFF